MLCGVPLGNTEGIKRRTRYRRCREAHIQTPVWRPLSIDRRNHEHPLHVGEPDIRYEAPYAVQTGTTVLVTCDVPTSPSDFYILRLVFIDRL